MITLVDTQQSNISSVANMLRRLGIPARIASSPQDVITAEKIILPGVGHFNAVMGWLNDSGFAAALTEAVQVKKTPILGICLGMHVMTKGSEEGNIPGLGWVDADVREFKLKDLPVPHMGWSDVTFREGATLAQGLVNPRFYFVHSYYVTCADHADVLGTTHYGESFVSAFQHGHIAGMQFHPEKSHRFGMTVFKNFAEGFPNG